MDQNNSSAKNYLVPTLIIGLLFFIFGFITWVNSTLIPYLEVACELSPSQAVLVTFASYIAYAVMAFPSSWVLKKTGFKNGMVYGLLIMALGALIFIPSAHTRFYWMFLCGLFIIGIGLALLQTAANPYITILGPIESAARRISVMGICNKGAGALAPLIMGSVLLTGMEKFQHLANLPVAAKDLLLQELASRIVWPYIIIAVAFIALAIAIRFSSLPDIREEAETNPEHSVGEREHIFKYPYLWLGFITLFLYVGVEVLAGDTIQLYGHSGLNISLDIARHFTTYTMLGMLGGYLLGIVLIPKVISQSGALAVAAVLGLIFSFGVIFGKGEWSLSLPMISEAPIHLNWSITFLALLGFANAPMWPAIWPLSIDGLGRFLKAGSALLIVAIAGGAILPKLWTMIAARQGVGMQQAFWIFIPCYAFILFFALKGHKAGKA
ncbi:MAG TPA: sugar MFS transporter [Edaphocola sp.]|nr:sugar MFS transporter [Edaphocola sp.]